MNKKKNTIKCIAFILVTILLVLGVTEGMKATETQAVTSIKGFYKEEENSLDAVVIGASEIYTGYLPTKAYEEYGYTSYSLGAPAVSGDLYKTLLMEVLRTQKPKVVAFEINGFIHGDEYYTSSGSHHNVIDNLKISENWKDAIEHYVDEDQKWSYFFPIATYHSKLSLLGRMKDNMLARLMIQKNGVTVLKGVTTVSYCEKIEKRKKRGSVEFAGDGEKYLRELLETCKEQGVENVLVFRAPHASELKNPEELNNIWSIVEEYGYDTINFDTNFDELGIDLSQDFYNVEHMNIFGAERFTEILGNFLQEKYNLQETHDEALVKQWNDRAAKADKIFEEIKQNIDAGELYRYSELAVSLGKKPVELEDIELK